MSNKEKSASFLRLCSEGISPEKCDGARALGHFFLLFLVPEVKRRRHKNREEGVVVSLGCRSHQTENTFFLLLHWFSRESFTI